MISSFHIKNFSFFEEFRTDSVSNITVITGINDTGKTSVLKLLYASVKAYVEYLKARNYDSSSFKKILSEKLHNTFQDRKRGIGSIVNRKSNDFLKVEITVSHQNGQRVPFYFSFTKDAKSQVGDCSESLIRVEQPNTNAIFLPSKEILTAFEAIRFTRKEKLYGFDDTYLDLIESLMVPSRQGKQTGQLPQVNKMLEELFEGEVKKNTDSDSFVFVKDRQEFDMSVTSEGIKKIGILTTLIRNKELDSGTVLFLDEPETALHPLAISTFMDMLYKLSESGVQIFLTTHNFFVLKKLELIARANHYNINCISLHKMNGNVTFEQHNLKNGLPDNPIIAASINLYNEEVDIDLR